MKNHVQQGHYNKPVRSTRKLARDFAKLNLASYPLEYLVPSSILNKFRKCAVFDLPAFPVLNLLRVRDSKRRNKPFSGKENQR